jgi:hypothetical protein
MRPVAIDDMATMSRSTLSLRRFSQTSTTGKSSIVGTGTDNFLAGSMTDSIWRVI